MSLAIKGASLLGEQTRDLYVDDAGVLVDEAPSGAETIDAEGLVALPGLVDEHSHLRVQGREDAETRLTGSLAAALGG
jgi:dihydroorotase